MLLVVYYLVNVCQATGKILSQYRGPPVPPRWGNKEVETMVTINSVNDEE